MFKRDRMFHRFALYGFLKNLKFFEPFIILFFREAELSFFQIGLLFSIRDLATNVLEVPTGVYADAFGRRRSMVMAFVSYIASFIIFFLFPNFYIYAVAMITVLLSIYVHGATAAPGARWYGERMADEERVSADAAEKARVSEMPLRVAPRN